MKKQSRVFLAASAVFFAAPASVCAAYAGKVGGIELSGSSGLYAYNDGIIFKDGVALPDVEGEAERAKRVALFYLWLDRDPFFLAPAGDAAGMEQVLAKLAAMEARILSLLPAPEKLYPLKFLSAYVEASGSFDIFSSSPSEGNAAAVLKKVTLAVAEYSSGAERISASVGRFYDLRGSDQLAGPGGGGITNKATVLRDYALIKQNGAEAGKRLAELALCLEKSSSYCRPEWPHLPARPAQKKHSAHIFKPTELGLDKWPVRGPYLVRAPCWHNQTDNYFYYHERCEGDGVCLDWDYLATDMLFRPASAPSAIPGQTNRKLEAFNAASLYACGDKEYVPVLRAMAHFERDYGSRPVFEGARLPVLPAGTAAVMEDVKKAERHYFSEKIKSQASFERLGSAYLAALGELDGLDLAAENELRRRARLTTLYTEGFHYSLGRILFHVRNPVRTISRLKTLEYPEKTLLGMFTVRNFYSLMFMPFSPAVWRIPERPAYLSSMETVKVPVTLHYSEARKVYGQKEIDKAVRAHAASPNGRKNSVPPEPGGEF